MAAKLLHKPTGDIYMYQPHLAKRDDMEEFIEGEAEVVKVEKTAPKPRPKKKAPAKADAED